MIPHSDWWILPLALFLLPVIVILAWNRLFRHKRGMGQNWVLAILVAACWVSALVYILDKLK